MTVREMINELQSCPGDFQVCDDTPNKVPIVYIVEENDKIRLVSKDGIDKEEYIKGVFEEAIDESLTDIEVLESLLDNGFVYDDFKFDQSTYDWAIRTAKEYELI